MKSEIKDKKHDYEMKWHSDTIQGWDNLRFIPCLYFKSEIVAL